MKTYVGIFFIPKQRLEVYLLYYDIYKKKLKETSELKYKHPILVQQRDRH